jgi:hypothetical protein
MQPGDSDVRADPWAVEYGAETPGAGTFPAEVAVDVDVTVETLISHETSPFRVEGVERAAGQDLAYAKQPKVTPGYFRVMGIGLLRGRTFSEPDVRSSEPVAIGSKGLADRYWPSGEELGKRGHHRRDVAANRRDRSGRQE